MSNNISYLGGGAFPNQLYRNLPVIAGADRVVDMTYKTTRVHRIVGSR